MRVGESWIHFLALRIYRFIRTVFIENLTLGPYLHYFSIADGNGLVNGAR